MNFKIGQVEIGLDAPLFVMAGPCVIESETCCLDIANRLVDIGAKTNVGIIFKASFDKANRSVCTEKQAPGDNPQSRRPQPHGPVRERQS